MSIFLTILLKNKHFFIYPFFFLLRYCNCNNLCLNATLGLQWDFHRHMKLSYRSHCTVNTWEILLTFLAALSVLTT